MKPLRSVFVLIVLWLGGFSAWAETGPQSKNRSAPEFLGITVLANPALSLTTASHYANGVSVEHATIRMAVAIGLVWTLQIRATDDLRYLTNSIPASAIGVQSVNLTPRPEVFLTTTNQTLAGGLAVIGLNQAMVIRYRAVGGTPFLKPAGSYTTTLVLTYTGL
ncbi:hypothetical protein GCM10027299_58480 [Larkinella ripae]